ncbi:hypothetical protein CEXT_676631 [Caerostris extrusa]|uniref:Copper transporter n=1 Tax=Caerostris extrusa TaxID=172846 RepID=A0AAV4Y3T4_CAEEX|nr:hypothetical protein CEXT_676631 [Caerostris extrusa]
METETLPKLLSRSLYIFGVYLEENDTVVSRETTKAKNQPKRSQPLWITVEIVFSHVFFLLSTVYGICGILTWTIFISGTLDVFGFILAKRRVLCEDNTNPRSNKKFKTISCSCSLYN